MQRARVALKLLFAWLPFVLLWALFVLAYAGASLATALESGVIAMGSAALLGIGVWWLSDRFPWPESVRLPFYLVHFGFGLAFAIVWTLVDFAIGAVQSGESLLDMLIRSRVVGWRVLMGLLLYGLLAGVSYSVRIRRRLRDQERVAARAEALAAEARLQALRAQLNPHFLFNALHSVSALVCHDPSGAEQAVERLGDLLRYALDGAVGDEVPLADEWTFTRDYLGLERIRFDSRLRVETDFGPGTLSCPVPSFTLQPLVENAVQYAVAPRPSGGRIRISARLHADRLAITVRDDGPGSELSEVEAGRGHGIQGLRERLQALYGSAASLEVETAPGRGLSATVTLPRTGPRAPDKGGPADRPAASARPRRRSAP